MAPDYGRGRVGPDGRVGGIHRPENERAGINEPQESPYYGYLAALFVTDLKMSIDFYENKVGFAYDKGDDWTAGFVVGSDLLLLVSVDVANDVLGPGELRLDVAPPVRQMLLAPVDDVDRAYEEMRSKGVEFIRPPEDRSWGHRCAYFRDPDGNVWELHKPLPEN